MRTAIDFCLCILLLALAAPLFEISIILGESRTQLRSTLERLDDAALNLTIATRRVSDLVGETVVREDGVQTVARTVADLPPVLREAQTTIAAGQPLLREATARVRELRSTTDSTNRIVIDLERSVHDIEGTIHDVRDSVIPHIDAEVQAAYPVLRNADSVLGKAGHLEDQVNAAAPLFLDCDHNPSCAFNLFQGSAKAIEKMAQTWERSAPATARAVQDTAQHADAITKPGWLTRLFKKVF